MLGSAVRDGKGGAFLHPEPPSGLGRRHPYDAGSLTAQPQKSCAFRK
jgi:hypothetical protein